MSAAAGILLGLLASLIPLGLLVLVIYMILERIAEKKRETFEDRSN